MKLLKYVLVCLAAVFSGCAMGPHMRMYAPSDSSEYNGMKVFVHSIENGEFTNESKVDSLQLLADMSELVVDSLPELEYRIGPMDIVQIVVWEHPELTSPMGEYQPAGQRVSSEGTLFYPYAGEIKVAGMTALELRREITRRLSDKILNDPQVDVRVTTYASYRVAVSGAVKNTGYVHFSERPMTLPLMIEKAGGFAGNADISNIQIRRDGKTYNIDYRNAFKMNLPVDRILLKPNDNVYVVPRSETAEDRRVYVMGEVHKPGVISVSHDKISLIEALARVGGLQAVTASSRSVYVIRNTSDERIDVYQLNAKNAMALAMADKFDLNPHDIVYVDASGLATWNRLISLILPSVQTVYYGVLTARNAQLINNSME